MFAYVMRQSDICIALLRSIFPSHGIKSIRYVYDDDSGEKNEEAVEPEIQKAMSEVFEKKSVRLDIYLDDGNVAYNVEMQTVNLQYLVKRARIYQAQIDLSLLRKGESYDKLKPAYVIFICTFDPFGKGQSQYTFKNLCVEENGLALGDETCKIFLNTEGTKGNIGNDLKELLKYMDNPRNFPIGGTNCELVRKIDVAVNTAKKDNKWRMAYMKYQADQRADELKWKEEQVKEDARNLYSIGISVEKIAEGLKRPITIVKEWLGLQQA